MNKAQWKAYRKRRYEKLKSMGLCAACAKRPPVPDATLCEPCLKDRRDYSRRARGGLRGICAICGAMGVTVQDHDHATRENRGELCHACNKGLGFFRDECPLLERAIRYLREYGC